MTTDNDVLVDVRELTHKISKGVTPEIGLIMPKGQKFSRITSQKDLYQNLMKNDKNYRKDMNRAMYRMMYVRNKKTLGHEAASKLAAETVKNAWKNEPDGFRMQNTVLTNKGKAYKKYAKTLAKAGYDGVLDYHDIDDGLPRHRSY